MGVKNNTHEFQAFYHYGPKEEQIKNKNFIYLIINDLVVRLFKTFIFPGASFIKHTIIDPERIEKAEKQLILMGGQHVTMKTPDGDHIDGMYLTAKDFKINVEKYFDLVEIDKGDGTIEQFLHIKPEFCQKTKDKLCDQTFCTYMKPNEEAEAFLANLTKLGAPLASRGYISEKDNIRGAVVKLGTIPKKMPKLETHSIPSSHPTVLISPGSGMTYAAYKGLALSYLLKGMNVMMVDFRGYGKSQGSPTDTRTKLDLETAYQYLQTEHSVKNEDLIVHGHCLGGGPASDLAARRPGVNLLLDRTFAEYRDVARERFPIISRLIYAIMPWIVNYNNAENLRNVKGHISIVIAFDDQVIPEAQITKLINHLPESQSDKFMKLLDSSSGHTGIWTSEARTSQEFNEFLDEANLRRKLF